MGEVNHLQYRHLVEERDKALKVAQSCKPKKAVKITSTDSAWYREHKKKKKLDNPRTKKY